MTKVLFVLIGGLFMFDAMATTPIVACPDSYVMIQAEESLIEDNETCPSGTSNIGTAVSCLISATDGCFMFIPRATSYTDESGMYEYTRFCPLS